MGVIRSSELKGWPPAGRTARRLVGLTKSEKSYREVLPSRPKLVRALLRVLNAKEQDSLSRLCRKLREGGVLKFVAQLPHEDAD